MLRDLNLTGKLADAGTNALIDQVGRALIPEPQLPGAETVHSLTREIRTCQRSEKTLWYWAAIPFVAGVAGGLLAFGIQRCGKSN